MNNMKFRPITIKYRGAGQKVMSLRADHVTGHSSGNGPTYWDFTLGYDGIPLRFPEGGLIPDSVIAGASRGKRKLVGSVPESRLLPGELKKVMKLYGRPWLERVMNSDSICLTDTDSAGFGRLPLDTTAVWTINHPGSWVIERESGASLHIMNNDEVFKRGKTFAEALKKLFPGKKITIHRPTITHEVIQ
jgi:hypothetical protein